MSLSLENRVRIPLPESPPRSKQWLSVPNEIVLEAHRNFKISSRTLEEYRYSQDSQSFIQRSTICSHVAHQLNPIEGSRRRKYDRTPYFSHPHAMKMEAMRMRQHPTIIIACDLHDIAEDVATVNGEINPTQWLEYFEHTLFRDYRDKKRLMRILRAELKSNSFHEVFKNEKDRKEVTKYYLNTSVGIQSLSLLQSLRGEENGIKEEDKEEIAGVLYDLNRIVTESFIPGSEGNPMFDPSVLIVKILDVWQNLQTEGYWRDQLSKESSDARTVSKLVRARVLTNIAELLGMRQVASEMTRSVATIQGVGGINKNLLEQIRRDQGSKDVRSFNTQKATLENTLDESQSMSTSIHGQLSGADYEARHLRATLQMPWLEVDQPGQIVWNLPSHNPDSIGILSGEAPTPNSLWVSPARRNIEESGRARILSLLGRKTVDYKVLNSKIPAGILRIEADPPRYLSTTKATEHQPPKSEDVPERNLFHPDVCQYMEPIHGSWETVPHVLQDQRSGVDVRHMGLIDFMYSPNSFFQKTNNEAEIPYMIIANHQVYLATNRTDVAVSVIAHRAGVSDPYVYPFEDQSQGYQVEPGDRNVLDDLRRRGILTSHMVIVGEKK